MNNKHQLKKLHMLEAACARVLAIGGDPLLKGAVDGGWIHQVADDLLAGKLVAFIQVEDGSIACRSYGEKRAIEIMDLVEQTVLREIDRRAGESGETP